MIEAEIWMAIALVAVATLASRLAGPWIMARLGPSARIERILEGLSVSVLAALVASIVAQGGAREAAAVGIAALVMMVTNSAVSAMVAGMAAAAGWALLLGV